MFPGGRATILLTDLDSIGYSKWSTVAPIVVFYLSSSSSYLTSSCTFFTKASLTGLLSFTYFLTSPLPLIG